MKITIVGGGPAGLYFAIHMMALDSTHDITLLERNPRGNTYGWGVVFSDGTLDNLAQADETSLQKINDALVHWDDIDVHFGGKVIRSGGHGFSGISRQKLLEILTQRAEELGVKVLFETQPDLENLPEEADLVVAADGVNSCIRQRFSSHFKPDIDIRECRYVWLGSRKTFDAFTFIFRNSEFGWFQAHCYRFDRGLSTFIVECREETWKKAGLENMSKEDGIAFCESLFADHLDGSNLITNADHLRGSAIWLNFQRVNCEHWYHDNVVLLGDAAATAHFSVGSGTKLAMESAIALARKLHACGDLGKAFADYEAERRVEVLRLQNAARNSTEWFEQVGLRASLEPEQFAYSLITRSQRVSHENLRLRDKGYLNNFEIWLAQKSLGRKWNQAIPPMFIPFRIRDLELKNRIICSPMAMYSSIDGTVNDFHLVHFGARAMGGAGLIFTEMTCVTPDARISPGCAGLYSDEHVLAWKRIVDFVHSQSDARFGIQIGHAGRKGSTKLMWEGNNEPLDSGNWQIFGPSPIAYGPRSQVPKEMSRQDMERIKNDFVTATERAESAGFDMLELHCGHGYLLSSFISPVSNRRKDEFGGSLENRMRYPLEVFRATRAVWPSHKPMSVRVSATDWVPGGITIQDSVLIAKMLKENGVDAVDVSAGQVSRDQKPVYGRMFQVPFSERIRIEAGIVTMAVGNIYEADHANSIIASGRADLCLLARPHLWDPNWTLRVAAQLGFEEIEWPNQYLSGKNQLEILSKRAREAQLGPV